MTLLSSPPSLDFRPSLLRAYLVGIFVSFGPCALVRAHRVPLERFPGTSFNEILKILCPGSERMESDDSDSKEMSSVCYILSLRMKKKFSSKCSWQRGQQAGMRLSVNLAFFFLIPCYLRYILNFFIWLVCLCIKLYLDQPLKYAFSTCVLRGFHLIQQILLVETSSYRETKLIGLVFIFFAGRDAVTKLQNRFPSCHE